MIPLQRFHQLVLQAVDVLEFVDHDVLQALLPLGADRGILLEDVKREFDQVVVVEPEALFLLIQVSVKNDVVG